MGKLEDILDLYKDFSSVCAIAIGGSKASKQADSQSDLDVYVFCENDIPVNKREDLVKNMSSKYEVGGEYFGAGDEFFVDELGIQLDVMYWNIDWFESVIKNVWINHYPANGYTTAFLYTLNNFKILFDKNNWLSNLQKSIQTEYPSKLKENIIKRNMMLMYDKPFASELAEKLKFFSQSP